MNAETLKYFEKQAGIAGASEDIIICKRCKKQLFVSGIYYLPNNNMDAAKVIEPAVMNARLQCGKCRHWFCPSCLVDNDVNKAPETYRCYTCKTNSEEK